MFNTRKGRIVAVVVATVLSAVAATAWVLVSGGTTNHRLPLGLDAHSVASVPAAARRSPDISAPRAHALRPSSDRRGSSAHAVAPTAPRPAAHPLAAAPQVATTDTPLGADGHAAGNAGVSALASFVKPPAPTLVATATANGPIAHVAASMVTITAAVSGSGTATVTDYRVHCYYESHCTSYVGDWISINESASSGNRFAGWSGGTCSGTGNPCQFTASRSETDTANFAKTVTITAAASGEGTATITDGNPLAGCSYVTSCLVDVGDSITITPTANSGNRLTGWSGGTCSGTANPCKFTAANTETDTANFAKTVTITAAVTGNGTATITDPNPIAGCTNVTSCLADVGDSITITPTANSGNRLASWSGGTCSGTVNPCKFTAASTETDTANFSRTVTITAAVTGGGTATITDANSQAGCTNVTSCLVNIGDSITITPTANPASRLTGWSGGTCSGTANPCKFTAASTETDTANFAKTVTITAAVSGSGSGTATITDANSQAGCTNVTSCLADVG
ncbi:MAG TPA: hypothetical protein VMU66_06815, partial [Gaiellales bacterium]|nr:hypothetical protein [Gaiellales bacterium]